MSIKKCPFRKDEKGNFERCYGESCMAYQLTQIPVYVPGSFTPALAPEYNEIETCKMMPAPPNFIPCNI